MKIPVKIRWDKNVPTCICLRDNKCANCASCEEDVVMHDEYLLIKEVMSERCYQRVNGRLRQK